MKSVTSPRFRKLYASLPGDVKRQARAAYKLWASEPFRRSLEFKRIHRTEEVYSVRVGLHWRAVALVEDEVVTWVWIGSHSDYDKLVDSI